MVLEIAIHVPISWAEEIEKPPASLAASGL
jgi:hypothetical protein